LIHARLLNSDALAADDQRWAYAAGSRSFHVLIVSPDAAVRDDLARVVRAIDPGFVVASSDPEHLKAVAGQHFDLAVIHDFDDAALRADSRLLIYPPHAREVSVGASAPYCEITERTDSGVFSHPILLGAARALTLPAWMEPLAQGAGPAGFGTMPLAAIGNSGQGRLGVIAFDVRGHLLLDPDRIEALVLTVDLIKTLAAPRGLYIVQTGGYVSVPASGQARVMAPDGASFALSADQSGQVRFRPLQAGRYIVSSAGREQQVFANYYDAAESDLQSKPVTIAAGAAGEGTLAAASAPRVRPADLALIAMAAIALLCESALLVTRGASGGAA